MDQPVFAKVPVPPVSAAARGTSHQVTIPHVHKDLVHLVMKYVEFDATMETAVDVFSHRMDSAYR